VKQRVRDLQTAIDEATAVDGCIILPGGYYVGDGAIPQGHHLAFSGVAHLKGSITIPAGESLDAAGLHPSGGAGRAAVRHWGDGSAVLNGEVRKVRG
jgi:hypothetical protein